MKPRFQLLCLLAVGILLAVSNLAAQENDQIVGPANAHQKAIRVPAHSLVNGQAHARFGIPNIDSVPNFNGHYHTLGVDPNGNFNSGWYYNTIGNPPELGGTTLINAPIVPVSVDMRNFDGTPRFVNGQPLIFDVTPFVQATFNSPVFQTSAYSSSSVPTQFVDAVQCAEYFNRAKSNWHTLLNPVVKPTLTMVLIRGTYRFALKSDGTCCQFIEVDPNTFVSKFLPSALADNSTIVGAAEVNGYITTKDISTFLFPATYLPVGSNFAVSGFHTYDIEPGDATDGNAEKRFIVNYSAWDNPGFFFDPTILDITTVSHEVSESFNDPFVASDNSHNVTPWWLSPNGGCQDNLEVGDVIEGLPNQVFPITMNGMTYHPQNEALLQWFEFESPSSALHGTYSYPDETTLTALSSPQAAGCQ